MALYTISSLGLVPNFLHPFGSQPIWFPIFVLILLPPSAGDLQPSIRNESTDRRLRIDGCESTVATCNESTVANRRLQVAC